MTDFNDPNPTGPTTAGPSTATLPRPAGDGGPDALAGLHKMSTTAGITSQEYVAINIPAIVAFVLGLASVVALLSPVLLVVPLAAIVTAFAALSQIRASNGTQTGRGFAIGGIVLALLIGGIVLVKAVAGRFQSKADREAIAARIEEVGRLVKAKDYDNAYKLFSGRFQSRINRQTFETKWESTQTFQRLGRITSIEWNRTNILFQEDPSSGARVGFAASWINFEKGEEPARFTFEFRKSGPNWEVDDIPSLFPPDKPVRPRR
jgi:hypothetical protein